MDLIEDRDWEQKRDTGKELIAELEKRGAYCGKHLFFEGSNVHSTFQGMFGYSPGRGCGAVLVLSEHRRVFEFHVFQAEGDLFGMYDSLPEPGAQGAERTAGSCGFKVTEHHFFLEASVGACATSVVRVLTRPAGPLRR